MKTVIGKILYGSIFIVIIPVLLIFWANATASIIQLPVPANQQINCLITISGILLIITGMLNLWTFGKGLPMNAFPPKQFVKNGIFAFVRNPIYLGSAISCFGVSAIFQSSSGFWLISPLFTLMIIVYTIGFENERTKKVFGPQKYRPLLSLPENNDQKLSIKDRIAAYVMVFVPWLIIYEAFIFIGPPKDAINTHFPFEHQLPVIEFTTVLYISAYVYALLIPAVIKTGKIMRRFEIDTWLATGISGLLYFILPFMVTQQTFTPTTIFGDLLMFDRSIDNESAAFPAFHVIWAFLAAYYFSVSYKMLKVLWYIVAIVISISCITTGNHSIMDVSAGLIVFMLVLYRTKLWNSIRIGSEKLANSWKEWKFGKVRLINHGFYAGAAGFVGVLLVGGFLGKPYALAGFITGAFGIIGAALWAQFIEGSPKLQRPYGYYGSVVGVFIGSVLIIIIFPISIYFMFCAFALAAPWIQILGRLRCLVQGCCHGKPTNDHIGLRFIHPKSRVNKISGFCGISLHPTQLYSIGANFISGLILLRLYSLEMPATFIIGMYLILNGLGRFIEEYFRGETQTPYWAGMRIYQWAAIISIITGAVFTSLPSSVMTGFLLDTEIFLWAIAMGIFATVAYGVDFPSSNRRFARLTSE